MSTKPIREVMEVLKATGLPWSLEPSKKHTKIMLDGRLIGVISKGVRITGVRGLENTIACIKRAARMANG